jgi:hypothetical protein
LFIGADKFLARKLIVRRFRQCLMFGLGCREESVTHDEGTPCCEYEYGSKAINVIDNYAVAFRDQRGLVHNVHTNARTASNF